MRNRYLIWILLLFSYSCEDDISVKMEIAREELHRKLQQHKQEQVEVCRKLALEEAEKIVDSLIFMRSLNPLGDSLYRPELPKRPGFVPLDSSVFESKGSVKPIEGGN